MRRFFTSCNFFYSLAKFSHAQLNQPTYPDDVQRSIHDLLVNRRYKKLPSGHWELRPEAETILRDPITREPYNYDVPAGTLGSSDAPGQLHAEEQLGKPPVQVSPPKSQLKREFRHILFQEIMKIFI